MFLANEQKRQQGAATVIQLGKGKSLLQLIDRKKFDELCIKWEMDKGVRSYTSWEMTCAHIMAFVLRLETLREIAETLFVPRSTFSDSNARRPSGFFQELCEVVLRDILSSTKGRKIKRSLKALDSTECRIHGSLSRLPLWREGKKEWQKATAKLHVVWNVGGKWIEDFRITGNGIADNVVAKWLKISSGSTYVFDRAYNDVDLWWKIVFNKAHFVTRLKKYPVYERLEQRILRGKPDAVGVLWDGAWRPTQSTLSKHPRIPRTLKFRHIIYRDPETKRLFHFITSDKRSKAQTIADIYRKRWAVELLFRWLKGNLRIRYFATKTPNAIRIQLAIAVLIQLLTQLSRLRSGFEGTQSESIRRLRSTLAREVLGASGLCQYGRWKTLAREPVRQSW